MAKKALGRGLDAILGDVEDAYNNELSSGDTRVMDIEISKIKPNPYQPRKHFDAEALSELGESITRHGLIQPIVIMRGANDSFTLIAGERRLRASKLIGEEKIKAIIADIGDKNLRELALIENIQRENLTPIELAHSYKELIGEYNITQEALAKIIKKSRAQITNTMRLLNLDETTQELIGQGQLTQGHAKIIVGLSPENEKIVVDSVIGQKLTVRQTENLVKKFKRNKEQTLDVLNNEMRFNNKMLQLKKTFSQHGIVAKVVNRKITLSFKDANEIIDFITFLNEKTK